MTHQRIPGVRRKPAYDPNPERGRIDPEPPAANPQFARDAASAARVAAVARARAYAEAVVRDPRAGSAARAMAAAAVAACDAGDPSAVRSMAAQHAKRERYRYAA